MIEPNLSDYRHSKSVRKILSALARVVCPPRAIELDIVGDIVDHMELSMRALPAPIRAGLVAGLTTYDLAAIAAHGKRSTALDADSAVRYFESWRTSGLALRREFVRGAGGLLRLAHYEQPQIQEELDYRPDGWISQVKRSRLQTYSDDITRHAESITAPDPLPVSEGN
jgi:hypothetical protein